MLEFAWNEDLDWSALEALQAYAANALHELSCLAERYKTPELVDSTITFFVPPTVSAAEIKYLLSLPGVAGLACAAPTAEIRQAAGRRLFVPDTPNSPFASDTLLMLAPPYTLASHVYNNLCDGLALKFVVYSKKGFWDLEILEPLGPEAENSPPQPDPLEYIPPPAMTPNEDAAHEQLVKEILDLGPLMPKDYFIPNRIALTISTLGPGGAETQLVMTCRELHGQGNLDIRLVSYNLSSEAERFYVPHLREMGISPREVPFTLHVPEAVRRLIESATQGKLAGIMEWNEDIIRRYAAEFLRLRPSVAHCWLDMPAIPLAAALAGVPRVIISWRSVSPPHFPLFQTDMRPIYRALLAHPSVIACNNSRNGRDDYAAWLGVPPETIAVNHNAKNPDDWPLPSAEERRLRRKELGIPETAPVVGGIARLSVEKDPILWVRSAAEVLRQLPDAHCVLFGTGNLEKETRALVEDLRLTDRIHLPGKTNDPVGAWSLFDVFLFTSVQEGLPNVLMEAQLMRVPIVTVSVGSVHEVTRPGLTALIVENRTPAALGRAAVRALTDAAWRDKAQAVSRKFIVDAFSPQAMLKRTLDLYALSGAANA